MYSLSEIAHMQSSSLQVERVLRKLVKRANTHSEVEYRDIEVEVSQPQHDFITDFDTRIVGFIGGVGAGKTFSLCHWVGMNMQREAGRGTVSGLFANTYRQLEQATLPQLWDFLDKCGFTRGVDYVYGNAPKWPGFRSRFAKHDGVLSVRPWGQLIIRSTENIESVRGVELGSAGLDEARGMKPEAFKVIMGRVRCPKASKHLIRLVSSPNGFDWMYDEIAEGSIKYPTTRKMIVSRTEENPVVGTEYVRALREAYDPKFAQQELEAQFVDLTSGAVYHQFNRKLHVKKDIVPDPKLGWQINFDFNRSPFCISLCQTVEPTEKTLALVKVVDEIVMLNADTYQACEEVFNRIAGFDRSGYIEVYGDASGGAKHTTSHQSDYDIITESFRAKYASRFVRKWPRRNPPIFARINAMNAALKNTLGQVRLVMSEKCVVLRKDLERVRYVQGSSVVDKVTDKSLTHMSDGLGYHIVDRFPIYSSTVSRVNI